MNLNKLFQLQKGLDEQIVQAKGLEGKNLLQEKLLALAVEVGELANETRHFKFWSTDQRPRTKDVRVPTMMEEDKEYFNPQLEELVDGWHFILTIGLDIKVEKLEIESIKLANLTDQFNGLYSVISTIAVGAIHKYNDLVSTYIGLGEMLGYTWKDIEDAYLVKNSINIHRQTAGY